VAVAVASATGWRSSAASCPVLSLLLCFISCASPTVPPPICLPHMPLPLCLFPCASAPVPPFLFAYPCTVRQRQLVRPGRAAGPRVLGAPGGQQRGPQRGHAVVARLQRAHRRPGLPAGVHDGGAAGGDKRVLAHPGGGGFGHVFHGRLALLPGSPLVEVAVKVQKTESPQGLKELQVRLAPPSPASPTLSCAPMPLFLGHHRRWGTCNPWPL